MSSSQRYHTLVNLLNEGRAKYHIEYGPGYSNHLSHLLIADYLLGASELQMKEHFASYCKQLDTKTQSFGKINSENWREFLGQCKYFQDYAEFFESEVKQKDVKTVIQEYFPILVEGISGAALHPIIQLGYGFEVDYIPNVIDGLAYMAFAFNSLGKIDSESTKNCSNPYIILREVQQEPKFDSSLFDGVSRYGGRLRKLMTTVGSDFLRKFDLYIPPDLDPNEVMDMFMKWTLEIFAKTGYRDFFLLHGVTAFRALKTLLKRLDNNHIKLQALRYFWRAHLCVYIIQGRPSLNNDQNETLNTWSNVIKEALMLADEHVIKVVMVCKKEAEEFAAQHSLDSSTDKVKDKEQWFLQIATNTVAVIKNFGFRFM